MAVSSGASRVRCLDSLDTAVNSPECVQRVGVGGVRRRLQLHRPRQ